MKIDEIIYVCGMVFIPLIYGLFFVGLSAYYRKKYVVGTRRKFKIKIEQLLEKHKIRSDAFDSLTEDLTELISGYKEIE